MEILKAEKKGLMFALEKIEKHPVVDRQISGMHEQTTV